MPCVTFVEIIKSIVFWLDLFPNKINWVEYINSIIFYTNKYYIFQLTLSWVNLLAGFQTKIFIYISSIGQQIAYYNIKKINFTVFVSVDTIQSQIPNNIFPAVFFYIPFQWTHEIFIKINNATATIRVYVNINCVDNKQKAGPANFSVSELCKIIVLKCF